MKTYKVFERDEVENALKEAKLDGDIFWDLIGDNFCNDVAIFWWIEEPDEYESRPIQRAKKIINEYMIREGCSFGEKVYIDITW